MRAGLIIFAAFCVAGCAWLTESLTRRTPDTRIVLEPRQRMDFNRVSQKNSAGQHIDEYRCPDEHVMVCDGRGGVTMECTCWRMQ